MIDRLWMKERQTTEQSDSPANLTPFVAGLFLFSIMKN